MKMKKYLDLSKLDGKTIEQLKALIGEEKLVAQRGRSKFEKLDTPKKGGINVISENGTVFFISIQDMPKYLAKQTVSKLIAG